MRIARWRILCLLPCLAACGAHTPGADKMEREAQARHPGCVLVDAGPGEGDSDAVYMILDMRCAGDAMRRFEALYKRSGDRWIYRSESEVDPAFPNDAP
ncbi:hypothetical protein [Pseudoxanthomonas sp.]|jgi:hypothetical protein|uniref:hypothetical protein n=1 Tax=Pseudoxanthomonas sp. TaxID=1871049 RepID=UPI002E0D2072|nr:hypothetical protein [Pseudoxanthomonas sp.]